MPYYLTMEGKEKKCECKCSDCGFTRRMVALLLEKQRTKDELSKITVKVKEPLTYPEFEKLREQRRQLRNELDTLDLKWQALTGEIWR